MNDNNSNGNAPDAPAPSPFGGTAQNLDFDDLMEDAGNAPEEEYPLDFDSLWDEGKKRKNVSDDDSHMEDSSGPAHEKPGRVKGGTVAADVATAWGVPAKVSRPSRIGARALPEENPADRERELLHTGGAEEDGEGKDDPGNTSFKVDDHIGHPDIGVGAGETTHLTGDGHRHYDAENIGIDDDSAHIIIPDGHGDDYGEDYDAVDIPEHNQDEDAGKRRKPIRGRREEETAYYASLASVTLGWFILPFISGFATLYLVSRATNIARSGRRRSLTKLKKARTFGIASLILSVLFILFVIVVVAVVIPLVVKSKAPSVGGTDLASSTQVSPEDVVAGQTVEAGGIFLQNMAAKKGVVSQTGSGTGAMLVGVLPGGAQEYYTYGLFYDGTLDFKGIGQSTPVTAFCVSAPYEGGRSSNTPYFTYTDTSGKTVPSSSAC